MGWRALCLGLLPTTRIGTWGVPAGPTFSSDVFSPCACSAASSGLGAQGNVLLAPLEPSDPGLEQFHPAASQLQSLGLWVQGGSATDGLSRSIGQVRGQPACRLSPVPPSLFRCLSWLRGLKFRSNQTLPQSAPLPTRQCQPVPGCLARADLGPTSCKRALEPGGSSQPLPGWGCPRGHSLSPSSMLSCLFLVFKPFATG